MTQLNAMMDLLDIISSPKSVQTINDRTLADDTAPHAAANPGKAIGTQARYYEAVQTRLNAGPESAASIPTPFKPRMG